MIPFLFIAGGAYLLFDALGDKGGGFDPLEEGFPTKGFRGYRKGKSHLAKGGIVSKKEITSTIKELMRLDGRYVVYFGFNSDDGEYKVQKSNPIDAESEDDAARKLKDQFESYEGTECTVISVEKLEGGGMTAKGGQIGVTYFIGRPEVDSVGRFGKKRATWKTCVVNEKGEKQYSHYSVTIVGSASNHKLDGISITQKEFDKLNFNDKMEGGGEVKFKDKVAAVKKNLLKRKKVPKSVQTQKRNI